MADLILVTGGARSGKSRHALAIAESHRGARAFIATCPHSDEDMTQRIARHRQERQGRGFVTIEASDDLIGKLETCPRPIVVIDCLTLWMNNLIFAAEQQGTSFDEDQAAQQTARFIAICRQRRGVVIAVSNEVGLGIIPANELARRFRDCAGRCNQSAATAADRVDFLISGIPLTIKGTS